jgi:hypothetical protein
LPDIPATWEEKVRGFQSKASLGQINKHKNLGDLSQQITKDQKRLVVYGLSAGVPA